jgi:YbbR domain-containing protein
LQQEADGSKKHIFHKRLVRNPGIMVLSLIVAIIVWMAIVNIEDPYKERTFTVPVETINEDALSSVNKVYEIIEGNTAQVKVTGKKSIVDRLQAADIRATADLSALSAVNAVAIVPELTKNVSSEPTLECSTVLKVSLEDRDTKQVKVTVVTNGTPQDGFSIGDCTARPNMLEISGGESAIKEIDSVRVTVNVNGVGEDFTKKAVPVAYDVNGDEVVSSTIDYGVSKVRVDIHVLQTKTIPVEISINGTPADGYHYVGAECLPEEIQVAGAKKNLESISSVKVPIDISGMKSNSGYVEQNISIQDYLPDGVMVLNDYAQVSLRLQIEKMMSKTISIPIDDIKFASLGDEYTAKVISSKTSVTVTLRGFSSTLDELEEEDFTPYVDCEDLQEGTYRLKVQLDLEDSNIVVKSDKIAVRIESNKKDDGEETSTTEAPASSTEVTETEEPVIE